MTSGTDAEWSPLRIWIHAARPRTLWAATGPIVVGTALAAANLGFHLPSALACLAVALLLQIGANFCNDYADFRKGADTSDREGPLRVTQAGLVSPRVVLIAAGIALSLALCASAYAILRGGWPIAVLFALCVAAAVFYTAGPLPYGYMGLGEVFVLIFFGPVAVAGTYYAQTLQFSRDACIAGLGPGMLAVAILVVNNLRDIDQDARAGKRTLAVRFGRGFARAEYAACLAVAAAVPLYFFLRGGTASGTLLALAAMPALRPAITRVMTRTDGESLNPALSQTAKALFYYSTLFAAGALL